MYIYFNKINVADNSRLTFCQRKSKCCSRSGGKNGVSCRIYTVTIFDVEFLTLICYPCSIVVKKELNKIFFLAFFVVSTWNTRNVA